MRTSVIVTVYDLERYVGDTIESVLTQTIAADEILVVDDASTDGSAAVLASFGDRIQVIRHDANRGVLAATVSGIHGATGDVLCFLDGDDLWERDKLAEVLPRFEDSNVVFCSHDRSMIGADGAQKQARDVAQTPNRAHRDPGSLSASMRRSILEYRGEVWLGSAWCIRRSALPTAKIDMWVRSLPDPSLVYQDHPLATLLLVTSPRGQLTWIDRPLMRYRVHDANYSSAARDLERARRIVDKGWATRKATHDLVAQFANDPALTARQFVALREYEYLRALYARDLVGSCSAFADCARSLWTSRELAKETARLAAVSILGPERFLALKDRRR